MGGRINLVFPWIRPQFGRRTISHLGSHVRNESFLKKRFLLISSGSIPCYPELACRYTVRLSKSSIISSTLLSAWSTIYSWNQVFNALPQHLFLSAYNCSNTVILRSQDLRWMWVIGRSQEQECRGGELQNAVHFWRCGMIGDGKGRSLEESMEDSEWCAEIVDFLTSV